jgi:hypothetical protein
VIKCQVWGAVFRSREFYGDDDMNLECCGVGLCEYLGPVGCNCLDSGWFKDWHHYLLWQGILWSWAYLRLMIIEKCLRLDPQ